MSIYYVIFVLILVVNVFSCPNKDISVHVVCVFLLLVITIVTISVYYVYLLCYICATPCCERIGHSGSSCPNAFILMISLSKYLDVSSCTTFSDDISVCIGSFCLVVLMLIARISVSFYLVFY